MDINMLISALSNPNSPEAQRLLNNLAMSPLDPAAAMQQLVQNRPMPNIPGAANQPMTPPGVGALIDPQPAMQSPQATSMGVDPNGRGPWSFNYTSPNNGAPMTDPANPNFVPPAIAQAASMDPNAQLVEGETGGMPDAKGGDWRKMLEGLGGLADQQEPQPQVRAGMPNTPGSRTVDMTQFQLPQSAKILSLADLLRGV